MRTARRRHSEAGGQAVLEMALVLPICIALVMNFLAIMIVVKVKTEATAATSLGAQSAISAPVSDTHDACVYAADAFYTTLFNAQGAGYSGCPPANSSAAAINVAGNPPTGRGFATGPVRLSCTTSAANNYFDGNGYPPPIVPGAPNTVGPPVTCTTTVKIDFSNTPLGFAVFWKPALTVTSTVNPSTVRQKCRNAACT